MIFLDVERDPSKTPGAACTNPDAIANIKCSFWGGPVYTNTATNKGQWRQQFEVAIAGSNGYTSLKTQAADGYKQVDLKNNAINAPLDCNKQGSYMGYKLFTEGAFDAKLCATACKEQNNYAIAHPPATGKPQLCRYFNTYILLKNGVSQGQYCSMYTQEWDASFATNNGQYRGTDQYTIQYSFGFTDNSNNGVPVCPNDLAYLKTAGQDFCTSFIGYSQPTTTISTTSVVTATSTPPPQIITVSPTTTVYTTTGAVTITAFPQVKRRYARREENGTAEIKTDIVVGPYEIAVVNTKTLAIDQIQGMPELNDTMKALLGGRVHKRAIATPASISAWPTDKISVACSLIATGTSTATDATTTTVTATLAPALSTTEVLQFQTVVVAATSTCTVPKPGPTAPSYTAIVGGAPSGDVPMVPGDNHGEESFLASYELALPFAVRIFDSVSTHITLSDQGEITVGDYRFSTYTGQGFYIYPWWRLGIFYSVDGPIGSRKIVFSWFTSTYQWGHTRYHFTATFDEAKPGVLVSKIYDVVKVYDSGTFSVEGNGKSLVFAGSSQDIKEGQQITYDTSGAGTSSSNPFDRIECCTKDAWHVCSEV